MALQSLSICLSKLNLYSCVLSSLFVVLRLPNNSSIRQFVNSSIRQFVSSSTRQFVNPSTRQLVNSSIRQSVNPSTRQFVNSSIRQLVNSSIRQSVNPSTRQFVNSSIRQFVLAHQLPHMRSNRAVKVRRKHSHFPMPIYLYLCPYRD